MFDNSKIFSSFESCSSMRTRSISSEGTAGDFYTGSASCAVGNWSTSAGRSTSLFSVRTSDRSYHSFSTGGYGSTFTPTGNGSFVKMHGEVSEGLFQKIDFTPVLYAGKPDTPPIGETYPDLPVGDALLPMLLMAGVYCLLRIFRKRKKMQLATTCNPLLKE